MNGADTRSVVSAPWLRFVVVGVVTVAVDTAVLVLLRELTSTPLWLAASVSYVAAIGVNFALNMRWVWAVEGDLAGRLARYAALVAVNYLLTLVLTLGLTSAGLYYVFAKWAAIAVGAVVNYVAYHRWVFV